MSAARLAVERMVAASRSCADGPPAGTGPLIAAIMQRSAFESYAAACIDAGRELPRTLAEAERNRLAWQHARQRAADVLAALVEADEERDALRAALADREDEVAELVVRLAEYTGITS